jgi:hypothetical protein
VAGFRLSLPAGRKILLGHAFDELDLLSLLRNAPQALRWIAAWHLPRRTGQFFNVGAPSRRQAEIMNRLAAQSKSGGRTERHARIA